MDLSITLTDINEKSSTAVLKQRRNEHTADIRQNSESANANFKFIWMAETFAVCKHVPISLR